jgi:hypothetical protein
VHDRGVQAGLHRLVQEDRVEHDPGGRVEPEGDVGDAEGGAHPRIAALELADRLDGLDAVAAGLLLAGGDREGEAVDQDVADLHPPVAGEVVDEAGRHPQLPLLVAGLSLLVDGEGHHPGAVLAHQRHHLLVAGVGAVAVLEVHRVDDAATGQVLQAGAQHGGLGGVQHHRQGDGGRHLGGQGGHVGGPVAPHIVDAQVQQVGAVSGLGLGDVDALVPVLREHRLPEGLGPVGVGALADRQVRGVLGERHLGVEAGDGVGVRRMALRHRLPGQRLGDHRDVLGGGAAASADHRQAEPLGVVAEGLGEILGVQRVAGPLPGDLGQTGVGHAGDRHRRRAGQGAQVLGHLGRAGGAVHPDRVDAQGLQDGERGSGLRSQQHGSGGLHGDVDHHRKVDAAGGGGPVGGDHRGLGLQQVLAGLDLDGVGPLVDHRLDGLLIDVADRGEADVAQGRQFGAGPDGAHHEPRPVRGGGGVGGLTGDPGGGSGELDRPLRDVVLAQSGQVGAEGVGLDEVGPGGQVAVVDVADDVGAGDAEDLVASLEPGEVVIGEIRGLQHGAHRAVQNEKPGSQDGAQSRSHAPHHRGCGHRSGDSAVDWTTLTAWPGTVVIVPG